MNGGRVSVKGSVSFATRAFSIFSKAPDIIPIFFIFSVVI